MTDFKTIEARVAAFKGAWNIAGTVSGRVSSSRPNLQNIPRDEAEAEPLIEEARRAVLSELLRLCSAAGYTEIRISGDTVWASPSMDLGPLSTLPEIVRTVGLDCLRTGTSELTGEPHSRRDFVTLVHNPLLANPRAGGFFPLEGGT